MEVEVGMPRFIVVKSDNKYLNCFPKIGGYLKFDGDAVDSPYSKMAVELANTEEYGHHVHLRCCYNNKYWVKSSADEEWIAAKAAKPEEDQSKWSCTMFKLECHDGHEKSVQFLHVQSGQYISLHSGQEPFTDGLYVGSNSKTGIQSVFKYVDWESLVILPNYVAFKDSNGKYINGTSPHSQSSCGLRNIGKECEESQIHKHNDGTISIKSFYDKKLQDRNSSTGHMTRVLTDREEAGEDDQLSRFLPVKVCDKVIALRNTITGSYCHATGNSLGFDQPTITKEARFHVEDLVTSRKIYDVKFRLEDARIYNVSSIVLGTQYAANYSSQPMEVELAFKYVTKQSKTWNNNLSLKLGIKFTLESHVPYVVNEGKVEISDEVFKGEYEWGQVIESLEEQETEITVVLPPMTSISVSMVGRRASCDVPFMYYQRDILIHKESGHFVDDGVFTGDNSYGGIEFIHKELPIVN